MQLFEHCTQKSSENGGQCKPLGPDGANQSNSGKKQRFEAKGCLEFECLNNGRVLRSHTIKISSRKKLLDPEFGRTMKNRSKAKPGKSTPPRAKAPNTKEKVRLDRRAIGLGETGNGMDGALNRTEMAAAQNAELRISEVTCDKVGPRIVVIKRSRGSDSITVVVKVEESREREKRRDNCEIQNHKPII